MAFVPGTAHRSSDAEQNATEYFHDPTTSRPNGLSFDQTCKRLSPRGRRVSSLAVCDEFRPRERCDGLSSPHVIQSAIPLSRYSRHGALARGASSAIRPHLEAGLGELGEPATDR